MKKSELRNKNFKQMEEKKKWNKPVKASSKNRQPKTQANIHYLPQTEWSPDEIIP